MPAPEVRVLPPAPRPSDSPTTFNSKAFAWVDSLSGWTGDVNDLVDWLNINIPDLSSLDPIPGGVELGDELIVYRDGVPYSVQAEDLGGGVNFSELPYPGGGLAGTDLFIVQREDGQKYKVLASDLPSGGGSSSVELYTNQYAPFNQTIDLNTLSGSVTIETWSTPPTELPGLKRMMVRATVVVDAGSAPLGIAIKVRDFPEPWCYPPGTPNKTCCVLHCQDAVLPRYEAIFSTVLYDSDPGGANGFYFELIEPIVGEGRIFVGNYFYHVYQPE